MIRKNVNYNERRKRNEEGRLPVVEEIRAPSQRNVSGATTRFWRRKGHTNVMIPITFIIYF